MGVEQIKINCISGNQFFGFEIKHQRHLPKGSKFYELGQEVKNGLVEKSFTVYKKASKKGHKYYIVFSQYF